MCGTVSGATWVIFRAGNEFLLKDMFFACHVGPYKVSELNWMFLGY
jgi:hypothetical protein